MVHKLEEPQQAALFDGWQETLIWPCWEISASWRGEPDRELTLSGWELGGRSFLIMVPRDRCLAETIEACYGQRTRKSVRYAIKKEPDVFGREKLRAVVAGLPAGYELREMDEVLFRRCREVPWCRDWVAQYEDYARYRRYGLGAIILKEKEPVSGASSYSGYPGGIEIEIDTREDYRRKRPARICGAKLILDCLERGWYPSWDAQNLWSAALAEKLGYHFDHEYTVYEIG